LCEPYKADRLKIRSSFDKSRHFLEIPVGCCRVKRCIDVAIGFVGFLAVGIIIGFVSFPVVGIIGFVSFLVVG